MSFIDSDNIDWQSKYADLQEDYERALDFIREIQEEKEIRRKKYKEMKKRLNDMMDTIRYLMSARNLC
tara:strand:+ start:569 stop:772 length:204 start_codon:yes stop_codon:yes gene_type:complete